MKYGEFLDTIHDLLDLGQRKPEPMFEEIIAALKVKLARPAVDREELAKLLHRRGNSDVLWEDVSDAMRDHFRDMARGFLASIGVSGVESKLGTGVASGVLADAPSSAVSGASSTLTPGGRSFRRTGSSGIFTVRRDVRLRPISLARGCGTASAPRAWPRPAAA